MLGGVGDVPYPDVTSGIPGCAVEAAWADTSDGGIGDVLEVDIGAVRVLRVSAGTLWVPLYLLRNVRC